jgi:hypothetical protein
MTCIWIIISYLPKSYLLKLPNLTMVTEHNLRIWYTIINYTDIIQRRIMEWLLSTFSSRCPFFFAVAFLCISLKLSGHLFTEMLIIIILACEKCSWLVDVGQRCWEKREDKVCLFVCLRTTYLQADDKFFQQKNCMAMGSSITHH